MVLVEDDRFPFEFTVGFGFPAGSKVEPENLAGFPRPSLRCSKREQQAHITPLAEELAVLAERLTDSPCRRVDHLSGYALSEHRRNCSNSWRMWRGTRTSRMRKSSCGSRTASRPSGANAPAEFPGGREAERDGLRLASVCAYRSNHGVFRQTRSEDPDRFPEELPDSECRVPGRSGQIARAIGNDEVD